MPNPPPQGIIADFVNKYESKIKPFLEKGDFNNEALRSSIIDVRTRFEYYEPNFIAENHRAHLRYVQAVNELNSLIKGEVPQGEHPNFSRRLNKAVSELDFFLSEDAEYEYIRNREKSDSENPK
ncbi:MAG: hypothetical protein PHH54_00965 [Candidatus Nanoarchaeia archaeon]|nr:hypothetical protein [Candidatus Nanoarchaeia archaeon]MDD5740534.1 hypothetical protein [Candidatus Nanoarchaeia archaeon]